MKVTISTNLHLKSPRPQEPQVATDGPVAGRIPRVARLMALAHRFSDLIREDVVTGQADIARLGRVTRARVTQIMNLLLLAPDIQEELLSCCGFKKGRIHFS